MDLKISMVERGPIAIIGREGYGDAAKGGQWVPPLWRDMLERRERLLQSAVSSMEQAKTPVDGEQLALYRRELDYVRQALQLFE